MQHNIISQGHNFGKIIDDLFNRSISDIVGSDFTHESPSVNILESEKTYTIELAAPGLKKEDFTITIEKDHLIVAADRITKEVDKKSSFRRREFDYHKFKRMFSLPKYVEKDTIKAKYKLGVLHVSIEKAPLEKEKGQMTIEIE